jgi:hypothetical protein
MASYTPGLASFMGKIRSSNILAGSSPQQASSNQRIEEARIQAASATEAANIKASTAARALAWQKEQFGRGEAVTETAVTQAREDVEPWRAAGRDALGQLTERIEAGPGEFEKSPGYEARLAEGQRAIERSAAARGNVLSGAAIKSAERYGQDFATRDYDNFLNRYYTSLSPLQQLSGQGVNVAQFQGGASLQGAANIAGLGERAVGQASQTAIYGGESTAEGIMNSANIIAAQQAAATERDYAYNAWRQGAEF